MSRLHYFIGIVLLGLLPAAEMALGQTPPPVPVQRDTPPPVPSAPTVRTFPTPGQRQNPAPRLPGTVTVSTPAPSAVAPAPSPAFPPAPVLVFDAITKEVTLKPGETNAQFTFSFTNTSTAEVRINAVRTSCGCTVPKLPRIPWPIAAGEGGSFDVVMDLRGKQGTVSKVVTVDSTAGLNQLIVRSIIPENEETRRARNQMMALADRQAVFRNDCASCHVVPTIGKHGKELYAAACGICHDAEHRASMVPDLKTLSRPFDQNYWHTWVTKGKERTLMPAFAKSEGGPLSDEQVRSLVEYLTEAFASKASAAAQPATGATPIAKPQAN